MKTLYRIFKYDLLPNIILHSYDEVVVDSYEKSDRYLGKFEVVVNGVKEILESNRLFTYSETKRGIPTTEKYMPYTATVTEDIPGYLILKPKVYPNCKLLAEKHGGYLQFESEQGEVLRIAINSHYYEV